MIKRCTLLRRREDVSKQAFGDHWSTVHADIAAGFDGLVRYNQNHVRRICWHYGQPRFQVDGIVELWFASQAAVDQAAQSDTTRALIIDEPNFLSGLTALGVGRADYTDVEHAEAKYMILALAPDPERFRTALNAWHRSLQPKDAATFVLSVETFVPGFTRETLWSEPQPPNLMVTLWTKKAAGSALLTGSGASLSALYQEEAQASLAVEVRELRIV